MQSFFKLTQIYLGSFILATGIFFVLLWSPVMNNHDQLFFRAGSLMLISTTLLFFTLSFLIIHKTTPSNFLWRDIFIICILFFFINWNFYGMVPFNVSRSNSVIILGYLEKNDGISKSKDEIKSFTNNMYFNVYDSVGVRLNEQVVAGNIKKTNDNRYVITARGKVVAKYFREISNAYNIKNNFLNASP